MKEREAEQVSQFDVVFSGDLRSVDAAAVDAIAALGDTGYRTALLHVPLTTTARPFDPSARTLLDSRTATLVLPADDFATKVLVFVDPTAVAALSGDRTSVEAEHVVVIAPERAARKYDVTQTHDLVKQLTTRDARWAPADDNVRLRLSASGLGELLKAWDEGLAPLIGEPPGHKREPSPQQAHGTLVIDLTSSDTPDVLLPSIRRETAIEAPRVVALPGDRAAEHSGDLAVETFPRALDGLPAGDRERYLHMRVSGLVQAHKPKRVFVLNDSSQTANLGAALAAANESWLVQPGVASRPDSNDVAGRVSDVLPRGWGVTKLSTDTDGGEDPGTAATRPGFLARTWHRAVLAMRRRRLRRLKRGAHAGALMLVELDEADVALPVRAQVSHPEPDQLPITLVVVTSIHADPAASIRSIVQRHLESASFRVAILAPPDWEVPASEHGLTIETLIPEATWRYLYGGGWQQYMRQRVAEVCRSIGPETVVHAEDVLANGSVALDVLEAARVRQRADKRR